MYDNNYPKRVDTYHCVVLHLFANFDLFGLVWLSLVGDRFV